MLRPLLQDISDRDNAPFVDQTLHLDLERIEKGLSVSHQKLCEKWIFATDYVSIASAGVTLLGFGALLSTWMITEPTIMGILVTIGSWTTFLGGCIFFIENRRKVSTVDLIAESKTELCEIRKVLHFLNDAASSNPEIATGP